jgi:hypothetical protein
MDLYNDSLFRSFVFYEFCSNQVVLIRIDIASRNI